MNYSFWKIVERGFWFFPVFHLFLIGFSLFNFIREPSLGYAVATIFWIYFFPPLLYRIINLFVPLKEGNQAIGPEHEANAWMIAHRIQLVYLIVPIFERVLNTLPGPYSIWLRLWGSEIGRMVIFAPDIKILDRTHLKIGSNCFVGSDTTFSCHLAVPNSKGEIVLRFASITIEDDVFIPAQCNIGPGSKIKSGERLNIMTWVYGNRRRELIKP